MGLFKVFLENVPPYPSFSDTEYTHAVDKGLSSFWKEITMSFPNAKVKDIPPDQAKKFRDVAIESIKLWVKSASPETVSKPESSTGFSSFNRNPWALQTQQWNQYT